jgi:hypothetical protein
VPRGWWCGREHALSPSVTQASSVSVHFFCYAEMLRWDVPVGRPGTRSWTMVRLVGTGSCV